MIELRVNVDSELADALSSCLFEAGAGGITEREDEDGFGLVVYCQHPAEATRLAEAIEAFKSRAASAFPDASVGPVTQSYLEADWQNEWLRALRPAQLTDQLVLRPLHAVPAPSNEDTLWFEPASCFGSGEHATTRLAAQAIERECAERAKTEGASIRMLDVGTGSGVLCLVAARRGAHECLGIDIDEVAVTAARRNSELNELTSTCQFSAAPVAKLDGQYNLVVANIDALTLETLAPSLLARLAPAGTLYITGLLDEQEQQVRSRFEAEGARVIRRAEEGDWILLGLSR